MWHFSFVFKNTCVHEECEALVSRVTEHFAKAVARFFVMGKGEDKGASAGNANFQGGLETYLPLENSGIQGLENVAFGILREIFRAKINLDQILNDSNKDPEVLLT